MADVEGIKYLATIALSSLGVIGAACAGVKVYAKALGPFLPERAEPDCHACGGVGHVPATNPLSGTLLGGRERCKACMPDPIEVRRNLACELA